MKTYVTINDEEKRYDTLDEAVSVVEDRELEKVELNVYDVLSNAWLESQELVRDEGLVNTTYTHYVYETYKIYDAAYYSEHKEFREANNRDVDYNAFDEAVDVALSLPAGLYSVEAIKQDISSRFESRHLAYYFGDVKDEDAKMYLQHDNGGKSILITDGNGQWYSFNTGGNGYYGTVDLYATNDDGEDLSDEDIAERLSEAMQKGEIYSPREMLFEIQYEADLYIINEYVGCKSISDIESIVNYEKDYNSGDIVLKNHDLTAYTLVNNSEVLPSPRKERT